jgi:hypothetical protein
MQRREPVRKPSPPLSRPPRIACRIAAKASLVLVSVLISVFILETVVRYALPQYDPSTRVRYQCVDGVAIGPRSSEFRHLTKTGDFDVTITTNQYGLRDAKDMRDAASGALFAVGVDEQSAK